MASRSLTPSSHRQNPEPPADVATRKTRQKDAVLEALHTAEGPLTPPALHKVAQRYVPGLGIATVYRALARLVEDGRARIVHIPEHPPRYEIAQGHHHHFYCRKCDRVFELHACVHGVDSLAPRGFAVDTHEITLYGTCKTCRKSRRS